MTNNISTKACVKAKLCEQNVSSRGNFYLNSVNMQAIIFQLYFIEKLPDEQFRLIKHGKIQ
jgi:hypothetical protein